jgi:hypothetical protein
MSGSIAEREHDLLRRVTAVVECKSERFTDILKAARVDPRSGLRFMNFSGLSFRDEDLRGFDFSGANLCGCNFENALIKGARFDQAQIGQFWPAASNELKDLQLQTVDFSKARDWPEHGRSEWPPNESKISDDHLPAGAVFQDAHIAPEMIVLPLSCPWSEHGLETRPRIAVSRNTIGEHEWRLLHDMTVFFDRRDRPSSKETALKYCSDLREKTGHAYRLPTTNELVFACGADAPTSPTGRWLANEHGVSLGYGDRSNDIDISNPKVFYRGIAEWCCDIDNPICLQRNTSTRRMVVAKKRSTAADAPEFHVVRELISAET